MSKVVQDYVLDPEMVKQLRKEFETVKPISGFLEAVKAGEGVENAGKKFFATFGRKLMEKTLELGEEYSDLAYEEVKKQISKLNGRLRFPFVPQRFIEIAYLSIFPSLGKLEISETNEKRLAIRLNENECSIFNDIKKNSGSEVVNSQPCRHGCLAMLDQLYKSLKMEGINVGMPKMMTKDKFCEFESINTAY